MQRDVTYMCPESDVLMKVGEQLVYASGEHKFNVDEQLRVDIKKNGKLAVTSCEILYLKFFLKVTPM